MRENLSRREVALQHMSSGDLDLLYKFSYLYARLYPSKDYDKGLNALFTHVEAGIKEFADKHGLIFEIHPVYYDKLCFTDKRDKTMSFRIDGMTGFVIDE